MPFVLASGVASLSIIVVITEIGLRARTMSHDIAAALVGAALLSLMIFPTIAGVLLSRKIRTGQGGTGTGRIVGCRELLVSS